MQRSGSQKALLVLSIINIVFAVLAILAGVSFMLGGSLLGAVSSSEAAAALSGTGITQGQAGALVGIAGYAILFSGVVELILGILGVRAANDNQKIMPVWVLAIIQVVLCAISLVTTITGGSFGTNGVSSIVALIIAGIIMWLANNIKKEAGK